MLKVLQEKKSVNQESCIQQSYLSKNEGKIKTFSDKQKLREFVDSRPTLQEIQTEDIQAESKWPQTVTQIHMNKQRALVEVIM